MNGVLNMIYKSRKPLLILAAGVALFQIGCSNSEEEVSSAPLRQVRSIIVESGTGVFERTFSGLLQSSNQTTYSFRVSGTIKSIPVQVGQAIKTGQVIAALDPADYELEVQRAEAYLAEANSTLRNAKADYDRTKKLYEAGNSSRSDLDEARAASETAEAATEVALKSLEIAKRDLSYTELKSQGDCKVASIPLDTGENVKEGEGVITADCGDDLEVELNIPESIIGKIENDMEVLVNFPAIPGKTYNGIVKEVGISSVSGKTTFPVDVLITNDDITGLKSGLSANVSFKLDNLQDNAAISPTLPSFAVGEDQNGRFVFVVESTGNDGVAVVKRTPVVVGNIQEDGIEISEGVEPGMRVVVAGVSVLRDGMEVKVGE
ncbi:MAG: efflux RND transporter periplasmic adaptor subunit [Verrucomicrobiota bacterium]